MKKSNMKLTGALLLLFLTMVMPRAIKAQNDIGAHFGTVLPLVSVSGGELTSISDNLVGGFPMGITVKLNYNLAFDLEVVPILDENAVSNVVIHPGILMGLTNGFTFGLRGAFETNGAFGVTPLLNKAFPFPNDTNTVFFVEVVLPIRFYQEAPDYLGAAVDVTKTVAMAVHFGVGF